MARIAFVVGDEFEDSEFKVPYDRLRGAGHQVTVVGVDKGATLRGKKGKETATVDATPGDVRAEDFDVLVIPGGHSPDKLRVDMGIVDFVQDFGRTGRPIAAICHGGSLLVETDLLDGKRVTSWPSIRTDLVNAGAKWVDEQVVVDGNLITSRNPGDLDAFCTTILERVKEPAGV